MSVNEPLELPSTGVYTSGNGNATPNFRQGASKQREVEAMARRLMHWWKRDLYTVCGRWASSNFFTGTLAEVDCPKCLRVARKALTPTPTA